ncbi:hypothetical protein BOX15_Mlig007739g1 [Macrostomum lignano]|uniref:VWFA domain-containing protein n=1 Tax=Macrostomum lignano TaxID=282301 RepID=A0A267H085_9PLAT|nr:hypothetical protein BOX15_Mlig007739g1 [Macrostomum lignano]
MNLEAYGIVNFNDVIEFAYNQFEMFQNQSVSNQGAMCNSIIMILSDGDVSGDVESATKLIRRWRSKSHYLDMIRIFTYSVGQHQNPIEPLLQIACENRGFFAEIPARGAVNHQAQHVTTVLSRPMALYSADFYQWHNIYLDSLGLGLMTSITLPLYNYSGNQSFMGLIGTDVTVKELQAMVPFHKFGPRGYAFAVNANGYIVFHPELKAQNGWLRDPPNVDLIEMEFDSPEKRRVRMRIVNTTGSWGSAENGRIHRESIGTLLKVPDDVHTIWAERTYAFTNVNRTVFAISVVMPPEGNRFAVFNNAIKVQVRTSDRQQPIRRNFTSQLQFDLEIDLPIAGGFPSESFYDEPRKTTVRYPSDSFDYVVPSKMPYCTEYYIPPTLKPPAKQRSGRQSSSVSDASQPKAASATPTVKYPTRRPWPSGTQPPKTKQQQQQHSADNETLLEDAELIRNAPANMANLLQTFLHNGSHLCHSHWLKAVAVDMALYESFFGPTLTDRQTDATLTGAQSVFLTGLSGIMGVQPASETWRYDSWREGWFEGYYQRAFEQPDIIFASVVPFKTGEVFQAMASTPDPMSDFFGFGANSATADASFRSTAAVVDNELKSAVSSEHPRVCSDCGFNSAAQHRPTPQPEGKQPQLGLHEPPPLTMFQAVTLDDGFKVAVVGATLSWRWISQSIFNSTFGSLCDLDRVNNTCYLLEDGGYIVSANENFQAIGHFLGHVDKPLMRHLVFNLSVYESEKEYDFQASCPKKSSKRASKSGSSRSALISRLLTALPSISAILVSNSLPVGLFNALLWLAAPISSQEATSSVNLNESCIKLGYRYYRRPQASESFESRDNLGRKISVLFLNGTNLVLAAASKPPNPLDSALLMSMTPAGSDAADGSESAEQSVGLDYLELRREAREDPGPDVCTLEPRFRSRPTSCYNWHPKEDSSECGRSTTGVSALGYLASCFACTVTFLAFNFKFILF